MQSKSAKHTKLGWKLDRSKISKQKHEVQYCRKIAMSLLKSHVHVHILLDGNPSQQEFIKTNQIKRLAKTYLKLTKNARK